MSAFGWKMAGAAFAICADVVTVVATVTMKMMMADLMIGTIGILITFATIQKATK